MSGVYACTPSDQQKVKDGNRVSIGRAGRPGELFSSYPVGAHGRPSLEPHGPQGVWFRDLCKCTPKSYYVERVRLEAERARGKCQNIKLYSR